MVWYHFDDDDEAGCRLALDPDEIVCKFPRDSVWNLRPVLVNNVVIFFVALGLLSFSLSYWLTARKGSVFFLGPCQVLVVQSFAVSFRLSKVWSLIEWLLRSFCFQRETPMLRILNSFSFCGDVDVLLQGLQHYVFLSPPDGM